ncbi:hypothetical protein CAL14_05580 [Bordetella genomosp. 9]|nr:hypothetical protein CAL14_05580 [Bordetella genomosp. 9]
MLPDGTEHSFFFKEYSGAAYTAHLYASRSSDPEIRGGAFAILVADSLCDEEGKAVLTVEQAKTLKPEVLAAMFVVVEKLNKKREDDAGKDSRPEAKTGSGTSSPSDSAAEQ